MASLTFPLQSCDCQVHIFGASEDFPESNLPGDANATIAALKNRLDIAQIARAVVVQPTLYGVDHRALLSALAQDPVGLRGVATIDDRVTEAELDALHEAGVRGARFGLGGSLQPMLPEAELLRNVQRIWKKGWHAKIVCNAASLIAGQSLISRLEADVVIDHLGGLDPLDPDFERHLLAIQDLLRRPNVWMLIANADRRSRAADFSDFIPAVSALIETAPDRCIWGSDWPHLRYAKASAPEPAELLAFLHECAPDEATLRKILSSNPARLYQFAAV
jgi:predicted TIM-barrel fold metal-dependent hydrolase